MLHHFLGNIPTGPVLDEAISWKDYTLLDLSTTNRELDGLDLGDPEECQGYIDSVLSRNSARVAFGGYLECRNLYRGHSGFNPTEESRDVHLGVDFWTKAGTRVLAPLDGEVHSFRNNAIPGDYGPTIILAHRIGESTFYSLYGHLSLESLEGLRIGKRVRKGEVIGALGTPDINVNYAPHLHLQLICDLQGQKGDYPGVCKASEVDYYKRNCPDPGLLFPMLPG
ncbi:Peptidase family M23 [Muriicola jejuensis]|uniref:Peptidoglycan DD-metalloendopeptidase family protein n=1 Tax=Muriicola jejuensis TaxID=504488 RepID=A0A6P0UG68_9FLAO|nr:peptidoglycan DD-metalloendopeptidase family protein [Muriicola jejuensis]NER10778.1 peptidoglycan DD-metalloendopeptidase family protein [Muriicola jejuensis]SMP16282.1 Peptidase family M23 [Muriicola jejuensis]